MWGRPLVKLIEVEFQYRVGIGSWAPQSWHLREQLAAEKEKVFCGLEVPAPAYIISSDDRYESMAVPVTIFSTSTILIPCSKDR